MLVITGKTMVYLCVGHPTDHVKAPEVFNDLFRDRGIDAVTIAVDVAPEDLAAFVEATKGWRNLIGFGLTIPHKEAVVPLLDELDPTAQRTRAVNTVRRLPSGRLVGGLLDGLGFVQGLRDAGRDPRGMSVLVVGAGGVGRAIAFALAEAGASSMAIANRSRPRAERLVDDIAQVVPGVSVDVGSVESGRYDLVVNATSLGMHEDDDLPFALDSLAPGTVVAEAVMSPEVTALLVEAERRGLTPHRGRAMRDAQMDVVARFIGV